MGMLRLIMRSNPAGAPVSGVNMTFTTVSGTPLGTDSTGPDGFGEYSQDGSPGPILAAATYDGRTKYFDGRSLDQLGTIFVSDIPGMFRALGNGVIKGYTDTTVTTATDFALAPGTGRRINVAAGAYLLDGHLYRRSAAGDIDIAANATGATRYDRLVMRLDRENSGDNEGRFVIAAKTGTTDPAGPALTSTTALIEKSLGIIRVLNGASSFVAGDITDERAYALALPAGIANGDLLIVSGGAISRLAKSTDGKYLSLVSGLPAWTDINFGVVVQEGDITKVANCFTLDFDAAKFDVSETPTGEANIILAADSITAYEIAGGSVGSSELGGNAVTAGKIAPDAVGSTEIAAGAVGSSELAAGAVIAGKIATGAVGSTELAAGAVISGKIATDAVGSTEIAAGAVGSSELAAGAVTTTKITDANVTMPKIAPAAIGTGAGLLAASDHTHATTAPFVGFANKSYAFTGVTSTATDGVEIAGFDLDVPAGGGTVMAHGTAQCSAPSSGGTFIQIGVKIGSQATDWGMSTQTVGGERECEASSTRVYGSGASAQRISLRAKVDAGTGAGVNAAHINAFGVSTRVLAS